MKRSFAFFALVCAILFGCVATVDAQSKALKKDVKKRVKELKKEGWKPLASSSTLEYAFSKYRTYLEEDPENRIEMVGIAIGKNVKIGRENAIMNGITSYASRAKAQVVGKMKSLLSSSATDAPEEEIDKFGAAYQAAVNTKIAGLVKQHLVLVKENKDGSKEFNVYMSIDEAQAKKAREAAALEAKKNAALGDLSQKVEEFIGEPVEEY
ncbi:MULTISPECIES: hypothetical protein [Bacteroides]|uniref:hypothetical protein n=1 Tax=Bacteroides TaxID=816 RepID=UPI000E435179|nr:MULTISPECIES: hypothetical protein [Bacteroides]MBS7575451.1 hypothetical protein [Bacteroides propionicigenes]RGM28276.1 hypothetical protein DXC20_09080 [Bacteroides sp. OM08-17BH]RHJ51351.1 hypothetical protein DW121_10130 [Bacteroides sp. AM10-21B]HBO05714.1 hypothetical protein [Bacteroides sp.]